MGFAGRHALPVTPSPAPPHVSDAVGLADPSAPTRVATVDVGALARSAHGAAAHGRLVVVASEDGPTDEYAIESEGVVTAQFGTKSFAFAVLERVGGIVAYDVSIPSAPTLAAYVNSRSGTAGDLGPEAITFIPARQSPSRRPLLVVGHEVSGTTAIYEVRLR